MRSPIRVRIAPRANLARMYALSRQPVSWLNPQVHAIVPLPRELGP